MVRNRGGAHTGSPLAGYLVEEEKGVTVPKYRKIPEFGAAVASSSHQIPHPPEVRGTHFPGDFSCRGLGKAGGFQLQPQGCPGDRTVPQHWPLVPHQKDWDIHPPVSR